MEKQKDKDIQVSVHKMYQFLVSECRYGYTRNNHLMPSCAYEDVKHFLPEILSKDIDCALASAKQLCEECISSQLFTNFYDGEDDELGHRKEAIDFIEYLLEFINGIDSSFKPYNYDSYQENIKKADSIKYNLYKLKDKIEYLDPDSPTLEGEKDLITNQLNKQEIKDYLFSTILHADDSDIFYNRIYSYKEKHHNCEIIRITAPNEHEGEVYIIERECKED
jgi:ribosomal protein L36